MDFKLSCVPKCIVAPVTEPVHGSYSWALLIVTLIAKLIYMNILNRFDILLLTVTKKKFYLKSIKLSNILFLTLFKR